MGNSRARGVIIMKFGGRPDTASFDIYRWREEVARSVVAAACDETDEQVRSPHGRSIRSPSGHS